MAAINPISFVGGEQGQWQVLRLDTVIGLPLTTVARLAVFQEHLLRPQITQAAWVLQGTNGHERYVERYERETLVAIQEGLGRAKATRAALIPIRKSDAWWNFTQDERRAIFEDSSHHIGASLKYLPAISRRLYQSRELGEPFDFLTWFEYAPEHSDLFEELTTQLRTTEEWKYVEREIDIRLVRN